MRNLLLICLAVLATWFVPSTQAGESVPVKSGRAVAQLVTSYDSVTPDQNLHIALSLRLEPHWHTYWRNAGGPGYPAKVVFEVLGAPVDSIQTGEIIWPLPKTVVNKSAGEANKIINYAFEDTLLLPMPLHISKNTKPGSVITIRAQATYLVCEIICQPEMAELTLPLFVAADGVSLKDNRWSSNINRTLKKAPKLEGHDASAAINNKSLQMDIKGDTLEFAALKNLYFFPYEQDLIDASADQTALRGETGVRILLKPSFGLVDGIKNVPGVLAFDEKVDDEWKRRGVVLTAKAGGVVDIGTVEAAPKTNNPSGKSIGLWAALIGALIGGLILNLMPCVFPVLSLKALGFARAAHEDRKSIRKHGWLYTAGVMLSFLALAVIILILKSASVKIGWGFQLQNPILVGALAILFFAIALNLFGLFTVGGSLQNTGSDLANKDGPKGAFFTGVLAVIVATPCTAPFMASALGFAFAQSALILIVIFMALGIGFALPFLALSYAPNLLARLPKPGPWMETFKQFLAFPMLGAAIWLVWVLNSQAGAGGVWRVLSAMLLFGFAVWLWRHKTMPAKIALAISLLLGVYLIYNLGVAQREQVLSELPATSVWSPERVAELRADGHTVFVDFTAAWCVTCKANERAVINTQKTRDLFKRTNTVMLVGDWTRRDDRITAELTKHGRSGVPLYLVFPAGNTDVTPQILPQILSYSTLESALESAKNKP